jgi:ligand-binding sensor domain-containing protein
MRAVETHRRTEARMTNWWVRILLLAGVLTLKTARADEVIRDMPYAQEYHQAYPLGRPGEDDVRAVAIDGQGRVWAATAEGVRYLQEEQWHAPAGGDALGPTFAIHVDGQGQVWIGAWNGLYRATVEKIIPAGIAGVPIRAIGERPAGANGTPMLFAGGPDGIWQGQNGVWRRLDGVWGNNVSAITPTGDNHLWIAGAGGLYRYALDGASRRAALFLKPDILLSATLYALASDAKGRLWIGGSGGLDCYEGTRRVRSLTTRQGLPNRHARALAFDADGRLWVATKLGVARYDGRGWSLRHSRRWLLNDDARAVAIGPDGTAWVATAAGVSAIRHRKMTLADKAAYFENIVRKRHIRPPGLIGAEDSVCGF